MKKTIKYILVLFLYTAAFLVTGERFVYHLAHFENTYWALTFEYDLYGEEGSNILAKEAIESSLKKNDFNVFRVDTSYVSDYLDIKTVYGTPGALEHLRSRGISPHVYQSLLIGEVRIEFKDFSEIEDIYESDIFYFIGTLEEAANFKNISTGQLSEYYTVKELKTLSGSEDGVYYTLILFWGTVFMLTLLLSLYGVILSKKETLVKLTLGGNPYYEAGVTAGSDILVFSIIFFGLSLILEPFSHVRYKFEYVSVMFVSMLLLNTMINMLTMRISLKKDFSNAHGGKGVLGATYIVKFICIILAITTLSANGLIIAEAIDYFRQNQFFEDNKDYNYYRIYYSNYTEKRLGFEDHEGKDAMTEVWHSIDEAYGDTSIYSFDLTDSYKENVVLMNRNAISSAFASVSDNLASRLTRMPEDKLYIFFPKNYNTERRQAVIEMTTAIFLNYSGAEVQECVVIEDYEGDAEVIGINSGRNVYRSTLLNHPVIILDTLKQSYIERYLNPLYFVTDFLYDIPQSQFDQILAEYELEGEIVTVTNVKDLYDYNRSGMERNIKLISMVSLLIIILEASMIVFTVRIEYIVNGVELAIKKTLGYGLLSQNKRTILLPLITIPICTIGAYAVSYLTNYGEPQYVLISGAILYVADILFAVFQCIRMGKMKTATILKGAKL